jgi:hypothetical protein
MAGLDRRYATCGDDYVDNDDYQYTDNVNDAQDSKRKLKAKAKGTMKVGHGSAAAASGEDDPRQHNHHQRPCAGVDLFGESFSRLGRLLRTGRGAWKWGAGKSPREDTTAAQPPPDVLDEKQGLER